MGKFNKYFLWMLLFIPFSLVSHYAFAWSTLSFVTAILGIVPLAALMGYATKTIVLRANPMWGGLIHATFGNFIELIIAVMALSKGLIEVVQASIIGSIIGNILLLIGLSIFSGGLKFKEQKFNQYTAGVSSTMLIIAVAGLAIPTIYSLTVPGGNDNIVILSGIIAVVLASIYLAGLTFAIFTHKYLFDASDEIKSTKEKPAISMRAAVTILLLSTAAATLLSEVLVANVEHAAASIGITQTFVGIVIIAIITNIAENTTAIHFSRQNKIDVSLEIGMSSAIQIALFVVPMLVLISSLMGYGFTLVFDVFQVFTMLFAVMIINYLSADGRCNWLEGAQLISLYMIIAIVFYFI
jgi:Ca2+:H+ antiporter